ncbi:Gfo/Idh/MocA family oxidoreductase [Sulfurimonas sp. C5]|uniref:Gfo/Idh/MocA family oxidoreductase n=1 Tax=Sulfurimonas sp. C5 TaxID=3036947 RepID=UPI002458A8A6|nr:Gfo/Idh/MocA family oxidoreductase [Sulfurimonas sp. C5]MDH4944074.1 Gfo/Idh/MocA family oxidoreductase [Sulfurimonas sp. C5]
MKKVAIIGAGQLGSRHLQGIAQSSIKIDIEVVEPFESSRKRAEERYYEVQNRDNVNSIKFFEAVEELSATLDLVIIATSADVRFKIIDELAKNKKVKNLILEKVLFQKIEEYYQTEKLLDESGIKCWVNHPRRMFPVYKQLKTLLEGSKQVSYNFQGGDWGIGCNALHFIDHLAYLVDSNNIELETKCLDPKIYNSKRSGYIEFNGLLNGKIDNHTFSLYSNSTYSPMILTIVSDKLIANIDEENGKIDLKLRENNWKSESLEEKIVYYQSELSNKIVTDVLVDNNLILPTYSEAMSLHIPFIRSLLEHMNKIENKEHKICPIT